MPSSYEQTFYNQKDAVGGQEDIVIVDDYQHVHRRSKTTFKTPKYSKSPPRVDIVEANYRQSTKGLSYNTQRRLSTMRESLATTQRKYAKEEEKKKFEILKVLNLLEKTQIKDRDLWRGGRPPVPLGNEVEQEKQRQLDQQSVIDQALMQMNADRLLLSQ